MPRKKIIFFDNGNTAVFDENGRQCADLQTPWLLAFVEFLTRMGEDAENFDIILPNGRKAKIFKIDSGYNWRIG